MNRRIQRLLIPLLAAVLVAMLGCVKSESGDQQVSGGGALTAPPAPPAPVPPVPPTLPPPPAVNPAGENDSHEAVAAEIGFGAKGHYDSNDYISVTVSTQFRVQEQITLLNIKRAMNQYQAINQGYPKTGEVFFKEIIEANGIALPELPAGQMYGYDPTDSEQPLIILKPKKP